MLRTMSFISVLVLVGCALISHADADQLTCANASSMQNVSTSQLNGTWFEAARNPNVTNMGCIEIDLLITTDNKTLDINVTYVDPQTTLWENLTVTASIPLNLTSTAGVNVSFAMGAQSQPIKTLKLLGTDYNNYAFVCGYTNASDESTAFAAVLTRSRMVSAADLTNWQNMANQSFTNFTNMAVLTQSQKCYKTSAASAPLPVISSVLALIYALIKFLH